MSAFTHWLLEHASATRWPFAIVMSCLAFAVSQGSLTDARASFILNRAENYRQDNSPRCLLCETLGLNTMLIVGWRQVRLCNIISNEERTKKERDPASYLV